MVVDGGYLMVWRDTVFRDGRPSSTGGLTGQALPLRKLWRSCANVAVRVPVTDKGPLDDTQAHPEPDEITRVHWRTGEPWHAGFRKPPRCARQRGDPDIHRGGGAHCSTIDILR